MICFAQKLQIREIKIFLRLIVLWLYDSVLPYKELLELRRFLAHSVLASHTNSWYEDFGLINTMCI